MSLPIRTIGLAAAAAVLAAACGSATGSTSPGASSTFPNVSPSAGVGGASATPELSGGTGSTGDLSGGTGGVGGGLGTTGDLSGGTGGTGTGGTGMTGDQLVASIPTTIGSTTLTVRTATPSELPFFDGATGATVLSALGSALGVDASRMTAALGTSANQSLTIGALDVPGADAGQLRMALPTALSNLGVSGVGTPTVIGGRTVSVFTPDTGTAYVYPSGSTVYVIKATDKALADQALAAIPE